MNSALCSEPFNHVQISPDGRYGLCCLTPYSTTGDFPSIREMTISEWFRSIQIESTRTAMVLGMPIKRHCEVCYEHERGGIASRRLFLKNDSHYGTYDTLNPQPIGIQFKLGNLCNQACRMCGPIYSSMIAQEQILAGEDLGLEYDSKGVLNGWDGVPELFWDDLRAIMPSLKVLKFTGGEPFIHPVHARILDLAYEVNPNLSLEYITNLKILPKLDRLERFREVHVMVSLDEIGNRNDYIRHGSSYDIVIANMERLKALPRAVLSTNITVMAYNCHRLPMIAEAHEPFGRVNMNSLVYPAYLRSYVVPDRIREIARENLSQWKTSNDDLKRRISTVMTFMDSKPFEEDSFRRFIEYNRMLDKRRATTPFGAVFPEFSEG